MASAQSHNAKCPLCGGSSFQSGMVHSKGFNDGLQFTPDEASGLWAWLGLGGTDTQARICGTCGHIDIFIPIPK